MDNNQTAKMHLIDNVLVAMAQYLTAEVLQILEHVLAEELVKVTLEEITTLPAEIEDSVDEQNKYIIQLFLYKKKKLKDGTKYNYLNSVKRLITLIYKPLNQIDEIDIYRFLDWYENHNGNTGKKNQPVTINNERRNLCAFYSWMRKEKLIAYNPVESVEPLKVIRKPIDYFRPEEIAKLRDGCKTLRDRGGAAQYRCACGRGNIHYQRYDQLGNRRYPDPQREGGALPHNLPGPGGTLSLT